MTRGAIRDDPTSARAAKHWSGSGEVRYDGAVAREVYESELQGGRRMPETARVRVLDATSYGERFLARGSRARASCDVAHCVSVMHVVAEKFRQDVDGFSMFEGAENEGSFRNVFERALDEYERMTTTEKTACVMFAIRAFASLEKETVRKVMLPLVSLPLWTKLSDGRLRLELTKHEALAKHHAKLLKKEAKAAKKAADEGATHVPITERRESCWFVRMMDDFIARAAEVEDEQSVQFCERFMELAIDLLSQLPTRRFTRTLMSDKALLVKSRMVPLYAAPSGRLYAQLVDLFAFYMYFEIDDHTGAALNDEDIMSAHHDRLLQLQRLAFKHHMDKLKDLALGNCAGIERRKNLIEHLSALEPEELRNLVTSELLLVDPEDPMAQDPKFLLEVMVDTFEKRRSQRQMINSMPLYPNEDVLWNENIIPSIEYDGQRALALPKLNLQFLTMQDYLLRNFNLFRLEATYEIREDLADVMKRMQPMGNGEGARARFHGWARKAVEIPPSGVTVVDVTKPNVGESKPSSVTVEVSVDFKSARPDVRQEWDQLRVHDVVFMLDVEGTGPSSSSAKNPADHFGLRHVRGAEVINIRDGEGTFLDAFKSRNPREDDGEHKKVTGTRRVFTLALDTAQYQMDVNKHRNGEGEDVYRRLNLLVRRESKENNFKAILACIRDLMNADVSIPEWLHDVFLGYGDPTAAALLNTHEALHTIDFKDTFLDEDHLAQSFPEQKIVWKNQAKKHVAPFRVTFPQPEDERQDVIEVESYIPPDPGPYPEDQPNLNKVRFTPVQVAAIRAGLNPGLTMVVGPPGTGKTDTAAQIMHCLYHNEPGQRTLLITHSNAALNDLFVKLLQRDVPARYMLRLGQGESDLDTELSFSRQGRVDAMLKKRLEILAEVEKLADSIGLNGEDVAYTCETAGYFWKIHVFAKWEKFTADFEASDSPSFVAESFPFKDYFASAPNQPLFAGKDKEDDLKRAKGCMRHLRVMFTELEECRAFELLRVQGDRSEYLLTKQAKIIAMTCTHAALKRHDFINQSLRYDNLVIEEGAQILEIETFIPMLLQKNEDGHSRLKRVVMIGDHNQLPPVVKHMAFQKYSNMDQSMFARFVRLGTPYMQLDAQGRARAEIADLYNWRYKNLGNLPNTAEGAYTLANAGFAHPLQFVDVQGEESAPTPFFYQNLTEAEYLVSVFQYMRMCGYPAEKISILTTYNGQKALLRDVVNHRCANHPLFGTPRDITTVDKFQGQQNDFILLSLVRSNTVGHLRDVRRLVVAFSRARLGLYVFGNHGLFSECFELAPAFETLAKYPTALELCVGEKYGECDRKMTDEGEKTVLDDGNAMGALVNSEAAKWQASQMAAHR
ncbi:Intron-binding protein, aquarius [Ostreococcus tauri]|uniref:Intron-binding protein, aquarius n=1 Tax=Ostreococcus tauri TaxID=70448 RepID=A0A090M0T2_OSTTA|nr:Intron-binding protein, aquarius [Ostreococcus tauri]CEF97845.1 Intron-binding protein, aquarius [Ostreococcus tauri]|eukprot:XP_022838921.1 Intron-binding protein, aquarius [Ostreococcus tauri]